MTYKVTTLLALIGVPRGAELHLFDLNFVADFGHKILFELPGTVKNVKEGKNHPLWNSTNTKQMKNCVLFHVFANTLLSQSHGEIPKVSHLPFSLAISPLTNRCLKLHWPGGLRKHFSWQRWIPRFFKPTL